MAAGSSESILSDFQGAILITLGITFIITLAQFQNQAILYQKTPNSEQRKLCLAGATVVVIKMACNIAFGGIYFAALINGLPQGHLKPLEWPIAISIGASICYALSYTAMTIIVLASLQRYYRLCSVEEGTTHEKIFIVAKKGSIGCAVLGFSFSSFNNVVYRSLAFTAVVFLCYIFVIIVEFYSNYAVCF
jgi:hypothetical protein